MTRNLRPLGYDYPTNEELAPFIGTKWTIARKKPTNLARYAGYRLLTRGEFAKAQDAAVAARSLPSNVVAL